MNAAGLIRPLSRGCGWFRRQEPLREFRDLKLWLERLPALVWVLFTIALALRIAGIGYGLPLQLNGDEQIWITRAHDMAFEPQPNPGWYGAPASTLFYPLAILFAIYGAVATVVSWFDSGYLVDLHREAAAFYYIARAFTALTGAAILLPVYAILTRLKVSLVWSAFALMVIAVTPRLLDFSIITRMDSLQAFFILLCLLYVIKGLESVAVRDFVIAGLFVGLAATSKYPGVVVSSAIFAALVHLVAHQKIGWENGLRWLGYAALASLAAAFLSAPFLFFQFYITIKNVLFEARSFQVGAMKETSLDAVRFYLFQATPERYSAGMAILAYLVGLAAFFRKQLWVISVFVLSYVGFLSLLPLRSAQWVMPLAPCLTVLLAYGGQQVSHLILGMRRPLRIVGVVLLLVGAAYLYYPLAERGVRVVMIHAGDLDTRTRALAWVEEHLPRDSKVLIETFAPQISSDDFQTMIEWDAKIVPWAEVGERPRPPGHYGELARIGGKESPPSALIDAIEAADVDYIIMSVFLDQYRREAAHWPRELAALESLLDRYPLIKQFKATGIERGPTIRVLQRKEPDAAQGD